MLNIRSILDPLYDFIQIVLRFENALRAIYNLEDHPYQLQSRFPRNGEINYNNDIYYYRFHGRGCSFKYLEVEFHFDIHINLEDYIVVSPHGFMRYLNSYFKETELNTRVEEVENMFEELNEQEIIHQVYPDYLQYSLDFGWFNSYTPALAKFNG